MFIAERLDASRWEVIDDAIPMACPVCETINEGWAREIADALNLWESTKRVVDAGEAET
jgi:hypothetical protein